MKFRLLLFLLLCFCLNSCFKAASLPEEYVSAYEFVFPLMDTTINVADFRDIKGLSDSYEIQKDLPIDMGAISCLFFLNQLDKLGQIEWLEPHIIADIRGLPVGTKINLQIYTLSENGRNYFWLPQDYEFAVGSSKSRIPETPTRITLDANTMSAERMYIDASFSFSENISVAQLAAGRINMKIGVKLKLQTNSVIKL